jgi:parallel beta-helix repeat protein
MKQTGSVPGGPDGAAQRFSWREPCNAKLQMRLNAMNKFFGSLLSGSLALLLGAALSADANAIESNSPSTDRKNASDPRRLSDGAAAKTNNAKSARTAKRSSSSAGVLPLPSGITSGQTVELQCGRIYSGTLNLAEKSNVTVRTAGSCGKASISPGKAITGWKQHRDNIFSAPIDFAPVQVTVDDKMVALAHYPNKPQTWAKGKGTDPNTLRHTMPNDDLAGALLVFRAEEWLIETRPVKGYADGAIELAPKVGDAGDLKPENEFYVEGKLWMLDSPGEWAVSNGRLYVWAPDGKSPEGRAWASPKESAINANDTRNVTIDGVRIFSAANGIEGTSSTNLHIRNTEIINSSEDGMFVGGNGLVIDNATVINSVKNGIYGYYDSVGSVVTNSTIVSTGMVGMPKRSKGGIVFEIGSGQRVENNKILNSSYIGIRVHKNAIVRNNLIDGACLILTDCGGIYTFARDKLPSNVLIEGNTIKNLAQRYAFAVYLDDFANGVTVTGNTIANNPSGVMMHNGFNNLVTRNLFSSSGYEHVLFNETSPDASIRRNQIVDNVFISTRGEMTYRLWSGQKELTVKNFGHFNKNTYTSSQDTFAEVNGIGTLSYAKWKAKMKQDDNSTFRFGQEIRRKVAATRTK